MSRPTAGRSNTGAISKEYLVGLSSLAIVLVVAIWAVQGDWSQWLSGDMDTTDARFIAAGPFQVMVVVQPETPQVGKNRILIKVLDQQGNPLPGAKVRAVGEMAAMGTMPAMYAPAEIEETAPGIYQGDFDLPMSGAWPLAVDIAGKNMQHVDLTFDMATGRQGINVVSSTPVGDVAYHTCSMHPSVKLAAPGTCPICGMNLIPVTHEELQSGSITLTESRRQTIGVKTGKVIRSQFSVPVRLQGEVTYDQTRMTDISLRFPGWIGDLKADFEGKVISRGEPMFTVYSPELLSLQEEYLSARKLKGGGAHRNIMLAASRKRLKLWGLTAEQIGWLDKSGEAQDYLPIFAPSDGVVIEKNVVDGSAFMRGERLLRLADLSKVWVESFAYERDLPLLEVGMQAEVQLPNFPGGGFSAEVMQIDPFLGKNTRTARVRLLIDNDDGRFRPGLFVKVNLKADFGEMLTIPEDAVLVSGEKRIVFLDLGEGRLKPQEISIGYSDGDRVVVRDGLSEGDTIVTSGIFLIAAESKLKSGLNQW